MSLVILSKGEASGVRSHAVASLTGWTAEGGLHVLIKFLELGLGGCPVADDWLPESIILNMTKGKNGSGTNF